MMRTMTPPVLFALLVAGCDSTAPDQSEAAHAEVIAMMEAPDTMRSLRSLVGLSSNADEAFWLYGYAPGPGWPGPEGTHNTIQPEPDCVFPGRGNDLSAWKTFTGCARERAGCTIVGMWRRVPFGEWKGVDGSGAEAVWPFDYDYRLVKVGVSCPWEKPADLSTDPLDPRLLEDQECFVHNGDDMGDWRRFRNCRTRHAECPVARWAGPWVRDGITWNGRPVPGGVIWIEYGLGVDCEFAREGA